MRLNYLPLLPLLLLPSLLAAQTAIEWYDKGNTAYYAKDYEAAINYYTKAIDQKYSPLADAYNNRGIAKHKLQQYDEAIKDYDKAISLDPNYAHAYFGRGVAKHKLQQYDEAIKDYDKAISLDPNDAHAYFGRGVAKDKLQQYTEAIKDYDKAISLDPNYARVYNNRGLAKENMGQLQAAKADYEKAIALDPNNTRAINNLNNLNKRLPSTSKPKIWVVAVGISNYQYETVLSLLRTPVKNAYEFVRVIEVNDFVEHRVPVLVNSEATKREILKVLEETFTASQVGKDDMVIFYFSGHGMALSNRIGICPYDYFNTAELITDEDIIAILKRSPARHKVCIIEACKTEVNAMGDLPIEAKERFNQARLKMSEEIVYITSTKAGEKSYEYPTTTGAIFSHYFLKGIKGEADKNTDKIITIKELFDFIQTNVSKETQNRQIPQINKEGYRDIPFIVIN